MGTSASSAGPGPKVPFDPPWLGDPVDGEPEIPTGEEPDTGDSSDTEAGQESDTGDSPDAAADEASDSDDSPSQDSNISSSALAPPKRYGQARRNIGRYARDGGGRESFQKAAGKYSKTGMGGAGRLAARMRASATTGARAATFLGGVSARRDSEASRWVDEITSQNLTNQQVIDRIVDQVAPLGGSRDEESCSHSMAQALSDFLEENDEANLLELGTAEIREITERFMANEAFNRLVNDIGQVFESQKLSPREAFERCEEMREYLREDISVQIDALWTSDSNPSQSQLTKLLSTSIEKTFKIYESESA